MWTVLVALALASDPTDAEVSPDPAWDVPIRFEAGPMFTRPRVESQTLPLARPGAQRARPVGIVAFSTALAAGFLLSIPAAAGITYATGTVD